MTLYKQSYRVAAALVFPMVLAALSTRAAHADVPAALVEQLCSPVIRLAFGLSPEARLLANRMAGETLMLTPGKPDAWRAQVEQMVHGLVSGPSPEVADDVYLRLLRIQYRFLEAKPADAKVFDGTRELTVDETLLAKRLAGEELSLRGPSLFERAQGWMGMRSADRIEFAPILSEAKGFSGARQKFLSGEGKLPDARRGQPVSAYDRALASLRLLAKGREFSYILIHTREGSKILDLAYPPGTRLFTDPASELVERLAVAPDRRDAVIDLALRLDRVVELFETAKAKMGFSDKSPIRKALLESLARRYLAH